MFGLKEVHISQIILTDEKSCQAEEEKLESGLRKGSQKTCTKFHGLTRKIGVDFGRGINFRRLT